MRPSAVRSCLLVLMPVVATAAPMTVKVTTAAHEPVADAVVSVEPLETADGARPAKAETGAGTARTRIVDQRNETFIPYVELFRPGDAVTFRNSDRVRHHVYSFSPTRKFDLVLKPGETSPPLTLDRAGIVAVGCNIHDHMLAYLVVSEAWRSARSGDDGTAALGELEPGRYRVQVWHPQLRGGKPVELAPLVVTAADAARALTAELSLLPDPRTHAQHEY